MQPNEFKRQPDPIAQVKPWLTAVVLLLFLFCFYQSTTHGLLWLKYNAFVPGKLVVYIEQHKYAEPLQMMLRSTFLSPSLWQLILNSYFIWVFGSIVELRLGILRYLLLLLISICGSWSFLAWETGWMTYGIYAGPLLLTFSIIGSYLVFFPEKKIHPGGSLGSPRPPWRKPEPPEPIEQFGISPWFIITAFLIYAVALYFLSKATAFHLYYFTPKAAIFAFIIGLAICTTLVVLAGGGTATHPLTALAIKRYRQLRALDMGHDEAIEGAARLISVPVDQVKQWVNKATNPLAAPGTDGERKL